MPTLVAILHSLLLTLMVNLTCEWLDTITKVVIDNMVDNELLAGIHIDKHGFGTHTTKDVFARFYRTYGKLSSTQMRQTIADLFQLMEASKPITSIFQKIENCQTKAIVFWATFTDALILKAAEHLSITMGVYNTKYRDYLSHNHAVRTYVNLKTEFSAE